MANNISTLYAQNLLGLFLNQPIVVPNTLNNIYLGLSSTIPASDGTNITELTDVNYARQPIAISTVSWNPATNRSITNAKPIIFEDFAADVPIVVSWVLYDAATLGSAFMWGSLLTSRTIPAGYGVYFPANTIKINNVGQGTLSPKGLHWANAQLNLLRGESPSAVSHIWLGLGSKAVPTTAANGAAVDFGEFTFADYARVPIPVGATGFALDGINVRMVKNAEEIRFVQDPASPDLISQVQGVEWNIRSYALFDNELATTPLYVNNLGDDAIAYDQDIPRVKAGMLQITE